MAARRAFLLRVDPDLHDALQRWARDDLRSLNAQVEFILRREIQRAGRLRRAPAVPDTSAADAAAEPDSA